jgi:hypothetical protein
MSKKTREKDSMRPELGDEVGALCERNLVESVKVGQAMSIAFIAGCYQSVGTVCTQRMPCSVKLDMDFLK